jgi:hypothetical protein
MQSEAFARPFRPDPPYDVKFQGLPAFATLQAAEDTIARLEELRQEYLALKDRQGLEYCRRAALLARRRAEGIAANRRISPARRAQKAEISSWFTVWLETPDLFGQWLHLRKRTPEYRGLERVEREA